MFLTMLSEYTIIVNTDNKHRTGSNKGGEKMERIRNKAMQLVREVFETKSMDELAAKLATGEWIAFAAVPDGKDGGYLFALGRVK